MQTVTKPEINQFINKGYLIKKKFFEKRYIKKILKETNILKLNNKGVKVDKYYGTDFRNKKIYFG